MSCRTSKYSSVFLVLASAGTVFAVFNTTQTVLATSYVCPAIGATRTTIVDGTCYGHFASAGNASHARSACAAIGGKLASIRSSTVNDALFTLLQGASDWIGGADDNSIVTGSSEGNFFWPSDVQAFWTGGVSGAAFGGAYTNWITGEPNDNFGEDCMEIQGGSGQWNDLYCTANLGGYICEIAAVASSSSVASESDAPTPPRGGLRPESLKLRIEQAALQWKTADHSAASGLSSVSSSVSTTRVSSAASSSPSSPRSSSASSASSIASVQPPPLTGNQRIVITPTLYLRSDSRINAAVARTLRKGQLVTVVRIVDKDWVQVRLTDGKDGFVWRKYLGK